MAQMQYAKEVGVNCRLMIWIAQHNAAGNVNGKLALKTIFRDRALYVGDGTGLLELLQDRVNAADENDDYIVDPDHPTGEKYIIPKKVKKVKDLIEAYVEQMPAASASLTMPDLIEGIALQSDTAL